MQEEIGDLADYRKTTDNEAVVKDNCQIIKKKWHSTVADPGFEEGGFQVCGQSPHGYHRQLPCKQPMLGGSGGMPSPENVCKMDALRRVFLHSGATLGAYIAEGRILVSLLYCTITTVAQMLIWVNPCPLNLELQRSFSYCYIHTQIQRERERERESLRERKN